MPTSYFSGVMLNCLPQWEWFLYKSVNINKPKFKDLILFYPVQICIL